MADLDDLRAIIGKFIMAARSGLVTNLSRSTSFREGIPEQCSPYVVSPDFPARQGRSRRGLSIILSPNHLLKGAVAFTNALKAAEIPFNWILFENSETNRIYIVVAKKP